MSSLIDSEYSTIGSAASPAEALGNIETTEQEVINHLRTAGLRRDSESKLVDDILRIRKERRQIFSAMQMKLKKMRTPVSYPIRTLFSYQAPARAAGCSEVGIFTL